ncbi:Ras superfamily GTP-binding protein YlqF [Neorhodopirellula lusitana]|uniref:Ribosome biogenesis GTPase A n=1 Tax=Neorhodopirellula lusitana TaxID=445327 RepID=A0ABY1QQ60_9BACT|nr:ribosome biogenesis GTPase YlqF [Neorhodopirellula lusitana]SMP77928.1 Ras superfamily GTP-binding protein YlqF [Neorhodopirellula lusitana]
MSIQWFPGHMHKARLEMQATLPKVDLVIEVIDARIPYSSENPMIAELRGEKLCLKILAKADLADEAMTQDWLDHFESATATKAVAVTTKDIPTIRRIKQVVHRMVGDRSGRMINAMIVGIPNVGKSTIINVLAGRTIAKTGNTPAVTQRQQRVNISDNLTLLDTPGMMWPNVHNANSGYRLGLIGSIKDTAMDYTDVGFFAARYFIEHYSERIAERFQLDEIPEQELEFIEAIGRRRGCLGKSNMVDIDRASRILINEVRTGGLGKLTLETPQTMRREVVLTKAAVAEAEEKAKKRDEKRKKQFRAKQKAKRKSREMEW